MPDLEADCAAVQPGPLKASPPGGLRPALTGPLFDALEQRAHRS